MKKMWRTIAIVASSTAAVVLVVMMTVAVAMVFSGGSIEMPRMNVSGTAQETPYHILSSVMIRNGENQGSGTIISRGKRYGTLLSAAHNFRGNIGGEFWIYYPDGTYTKATLLAIDRDRDLAVARVDSETILAHSFVPREMFKGILSSVAYNNGEGPIYSTLDYKGNMRINSVPFWMLNIKEGGIASRGNSGGGIFIGDGLTGVIRQGERKGFRCNGSFYACPHSEVVQFLDENKEQLAGCGDWSQPPVLPVSYEDAPPLWKPNPNVPIYLTDPKVTELEDRISVLEVSKIELTKPSDIKD